MTESMKNKVAVGLIVISIIANLVCFNFLPASVGIHFNLSGNTDGSIPKLAYVVVMPLLSIALYLYYKIVKKASASRNLLVSVIILALNAVLLFINIK
ncbi:MAG: DUF1648 domain-containing protein [Bacillota bacterium]|nr:DUF1648 domain-containing protein [Bacillota bacterium]